MSDTPALVPRISLKEGLRRALPGARVSTRTLQRACRNGELRAIELSGQFFVSEADLAAYLEKRTVTPPAPAPKDVKACHELESRPDSGCDQRDPATQQSGSFSTDRAKLARARAQMSLNALR